MTLSQMDYVRAAIIQALAEELTLSDLYACAELAPSCETFADAVNMLATMTPEADNGRD